MLDTWIISRLNEVVAKATKGYDTYTLDEATYPIDQFIDDLSVWYVRRSRDRLKGETGEEDRKLAYETLAYVLLTLSKVIAPVMPFIAERVYRTAGGERESVHLESWPLSREVDASLLEEMKKVREIVTVALSLRIQAKIAVRQPLQKITLKDEIPRRYHQILLDELNVKEVAFDEKATDACALDTTITPELQAEGDVRNLMRAIQDARKERGLTPKDVIVLITSYDIPGEFREDLMVTCRVGVVEPGTGPYVAETSTGTIHFDIR